MSSHTCLTKFLPIADATAVAVVVMAVVVVVAVAVAVAGVVGAGSKLTEEAC